MSESPLSDEALAHRGDTIVNWMHETLINPAAEKTQQLRQELVTTYEPLIRSCLITNRDQIRVYYISNKWPSLVPVVSEIVETLPVNPNETQREVVAMAGLVLTASSVTEKPRLIDLDAREIANRNKHAQIFGSDEDWLTSASTLVTIDGYQEEATRKAAALEQNVGILLATFQDSPSSLNVELISQLYSDLILRVYPGAKIPIPVLRGQTQNYHELITLPGYDPELLHLYMGLTRDDVRRGHRMYLDWFKYTAKTSEPDEYSSNLAWAYATYVAMHPHPDCNGTMARTLITTLSRLYGLPDINWERVKVESQDTLEHARDEWWFQNRKPLEDWFSEATR